MKRLEFEKYVDVFIIKKEKNYENLKFIFL